MKRPTTSRGTLTEKQVRSIRSASKKCRTQADWVELGTKYELGASTIRRIANRKFYAWVV